MARTDDVRQVVVQFKYASDHGSGAYGFLYRLDDDAAPELMRHGEDITIETLLG